MSGDFKVGVFIGLGILALMVIFLANKPTDELAADPALDSSAEELSISEPQGSQPDLGVAMDTASELTWPTEAVDTVDPAPVDVPVAEPVQEPAAEVVVEDQGDADQVVDGQMGGKSKEQLEAEAMANTFFNRQEAPAPIAPVADVVAAAPTDAPVVDATFPTKHVVAKGETLSTISFEYYNTHKGYRHIYKANMDKMASVDAVFEGQEIIIPAPTTRLAVLGGKIAPKPAEVLPAAVVAEQPSYTPRQHKVAKGDSLCRIARTYYNGDESMWKKILEANKDRIKNPDVLPVGITLDLPPI